MKKRKKHIPDHEILEFIKKHHIYDKNKGTLFSLRTKELIKDKNVGGYLQVRIKRNYYIVHRLIWLIEKGYFPYMIDHINGIRDDNRIENLRECNDQQNTYNKKALGIIPYKGVFLIKGEKMYKSKITINKKFITIGKFTSAVCAALAYDQKAREVHGEFARLNFPTIKEY